MCDATPPWAFLTLLTRSDDEEAAALDAEKLRVYERERLRFYYAIVECDSAATAAALYTQCDGLVRALGAAIQMSCPRLLITSALSALGV